MKRSGPIPRRTELQRGPGPERRTRVKPVNRARKAREFTRCYGSAERVMAMKLRPCDGCGHVPMAECPNHTHHIEGDGGAGMKAGYRHTVTLCPACHTRWHQLGSTALFDAERGTDLHATAARLATEILP